MNQSSQNLMQRLKLPPEMMERFNKLTPQQQQRFLLLQQQRLEESQKQKLQQQQQLRGSTTSPSSAVPPRAASPTAMKQPAVIGGANYQRPAGTSGGVTQQQQHQHQQQQQPMSKEDMARRLQRLGFLKQQQSLIDAHQQAVPSVIPDSIRKASLIQTQRGRGLSLKQTSIPTSAVGAVGTLATTAAPTTSSRDQSPFNEEEDLDSDRLFVLSSKHCGAQVITKYNVALHYFVAGVDVAPPPPAPPPPSSSMPVTQQPPAATLVDSSISVLPPQALSAVAGASVTTLDGSLASLSVGGRVSTPTLPTSQQGAEHLSQNAQRSTPTKPPSPPVVGSRGQSPAPVAAAAAAKLDFSGVSPPSGTPTKALNVQLPPQPPPAASAASAASAAAKKHRLVFCIAENPNASLRPVEERQAMWRALTALSKLHMVCSMRTFKATFASFFVEDEEDDSAGKEKKPTAAGSDLHVKSTSSSEKKKVAHALRDLTRSSAVPILNALFPIFDQSLSSSTEVVTAAVTRGEDNSGEAVFRGTRCWDSSGTVWCPVARLGRIVIQDSSSAAAAPSASTDPSVAAPQGKTVYALNPLTVALREDISYVTKLPIMNELQDKFMNKRQNLIDEHQSNVGNLQKEMSMLELELEWAQEQLDGRHAKHDSSMKGLQRSLEDLHMRLQEASGRRFYIPVETKKKELERNYPSGALERSPIRQLYHWNPAIIDDMSSGGTTTTAAAQLFSRKLGASNILFDDADQQAVLSAHPRSTNGRLSQHTARVPDAIAQTAVGKLLKGWTQAHSYEPKLAAAQTTSCTTALFEAQAKGPVILAHQTQVQKAGAHPNAHHGKNEDEILPAAKFGIRPVKSAAQTLTKDASMSQHNDHHSIARALRF